MIEAIAPYYAVIVASKEFAILAFFLVMIWAVIKTVKKDKENKKGE